MNRKQGCFAILMLAAFSASASSQAVTGRVLESEVLVPVGNVLVLALDTTFMTVARTTADDAGGFAFEQLPAGTYLFQAVRHDRSGFVSRPVLVSERSELWIELVLPSDMFELAMRCPADGGTRLVGLVYESNGVPLPGARVTVYSSVAGDSLLATTDASGRYRFCRAPADGVDAVAVSVLGHRFEQPVDLGRDLLVRADFEVTLGVGSSALKVVRATPISDSLAVRVVGVLRDSESGEPVTGAVVRLGDDGADTVTDDAGRFVIVTSDDGPLVIEVEHIGYGTQREPIELSFGNEVQLEVTLAPTAIVLDRIEAVGNARELWDRRASPERVDMLTGRELALEEARGGRIASAVSARFPSLKVSEGWFLTRYGVSRGVCMESIRRMMSLSPAGLGQSSGSSGGSAPAGTRSCNTIEVIVDDLRVSDPVGFLGTVNLGDFESISYMSAVSAGIRFGREAGAHGGVLVLWSRGRGPYISESRNIPPL